MTERISREDCIRFYEIETDFFDELMYAELIETFVEEGTIYIGYDSLEQFEKMVYWHYDLGINIPGLEVINRLLRQMNEMSNSLHLRLK